MSHWSEDALIYQIYPLGFCGAPATNDFQTPPVERLWKIVDWADHIQSLGVNTLYLGPVFESTSHGYDTLDYYWVDRRLGKNETLAALVKEYHRRGIRVVLDGVFNHTGRDFWAFKDVLVNGPQSAYKDWFQNLRFGGSSPYHDPFSYEGWRGHYSLVKINPNHPGVKEHLFNAIRTWVEQFDIDGLRLDAVDCIDHGFLQELSSFCRGLKPDFWLVGEVVAGDYKAWIHPGELDSVTNYECYKGLYSSHKRSQLL